ncbi:hypothetical protein ACVK00_002694 [Burkholderia sp. PvR073]|uniref:hypothetical protein n=1 Tax=Burkholderia ambifaria TaxID=152480 RepID=UPI00254DF118|nr:hypothetical protein [Burkholderia sp. lyk4-R2A-23]
MVKTVLIDALPRNSVLISDAQRQALRADIRQRLVTALMRSGDAVTDPKLARLPGPVRYHVVGPANLDAEEAGSAPSDSAQREVSGHWRRPPFRMQPYGPQAAWRKLIFVGPTLVRPDRVGW